MKKLCLRFLVPYPWTKDSPVCKGRTHTKALSGSWYPEQPGQGGTRSWLRAGRIHANTSRKERWLCFMAVQSRWRPVFSLGFLVRGKWRVIQGSWSSWNLPWALKEEQGEVFSMFVVYICPWLCFDPCLICSARIVSKQSLCICSEPQLQPYPFTHVPDTPGLPSRIPEGKEKKNPTHRLQHKNQV